MEEVQNLLNERLSVLISASLFFILGASLAWNLGYFNFTRKDEIQESPSIGKKVLIVFSIFLFIQLFVVPLCFEFWNYFYRLGDAESTKTITPEIQGWFSIFAIFLSSLGVFSYFRCLPQNIRQLIWGPYAFKGWKSRLEDFYIGIATWIISYPLVVAVGQAISLIISFFYKNIQPEQVAVKQIKTAATSDGQLFVLVFCVIFIVPILEEILFRGFLQNWFKSHFGRKKAIIFTAIVFALFHYAPSQGAGNIELLASLFVLACFLGYIYERQKSLWASISMHAIFNSISISLIFFIEKG
jgi:hypothetical protein